MSDYKSLADLELFNRISQNDSKALEALYDKYSPILYTLIKKIVQDQNTAENILAEVFSIIWRKIDFFNFNSGNVYAWLITLTRNKAIDHIRRSNENPIEDEYSDEFENTMILPNLSESIDALDLTTALKVKGNMENALSKLTDAQKYVIHLAYYEGYTQKGIAEKLNIPVQTVKTKVRIALNNLKDNLVKEND